MTNPVSSAAVATSAPAPPQVACRLCGSQDRRLVLDLGVSPPSNKLVPVARAHLGETFYPLVLWVCADCRLVQVDEFLTPEDLFDDYLYFSSFSDSWLDHSRRFAESACARFGLDATSTVVEIASNDGYLLKNFAAKGIPVLGVEPAANVAAVARAAGIPTETRFFGRETAEALRAAGYAADLLVANNVLAHVPDLNGFIAGLATQVRPTGVITCEFSHLLRMIEATQFDSIYHEHFCYFSLRVIVRAFARHGLDVFDVEEIPTHGGSLRVYAAPVSAHRPVSEAVANVLALEDAAGLDTLECYTRFGAAAEEVKRALLTLLIEARRSGRRIVGYGAAAKGNTLLNYCGIRTDFLDYIADRSPHKQGLLAPGTRVPVVSPDRIRETRPDDILILAWNLTEEVTAQLADAQHWGARFVVPLPHPRFLPA